MKRSMIQSNVNHTPFVFDSRIKGFLRFRGEIGGKIVLLQAGDLRVFV